MRIPQAVTLNLAAQLCDALDHVHNLKDEKGAPLGIVHRDVTPCEYPLSSDTGLPSSRSTSGSPRPRNMTEHTAKGVIKGKFGYVAPEYLAGELPDHRADLWAVGIESFRRQEYWTIEATFRTGNGDEFKARLNAIDGGRLGKLDIADEASARAIEAALAGGAFTVASVESRPVKRHPAAPFTTSTLQQEASRKLGFSAARTMQVAQRLYEGVDIDGEVTGLITYMRTDGVQMAPEAIAATRNAIQRRYGEPYLPAAPRNTRQGQERPGSP